MKHLSFISSPPISDNRLSGWEFAGLGMKLLFIGMGFLLEPEARDRSNEQGREIAQRNLVFATNDLLDAVQQLNHRSGRYKYKAVPT